MLPEITLSEYAAALDDVAGETLRDAQWFAPPVDAIQVARRLGMVVALDRGLAGRARWAEVGAAGAATPTILIRPQPRPEREQWSVAHEIGERQAEAAFARLGVDPRETRPGAREEVANALARRLLLPGVWFAPAAVERDWDLLELKPVFVTASHELIARRMLDFSPRIVVTVFDHDRVTFRRTNLPRPAPPLLPEEFATRRRAAQHGEPVADRFGAIRIRAWPIHEPDWRREILRTEIEGEE